MKKWIAFLVTSFVLALLAITIWLGWTPFSALLGAQGEMIQSADSFISILVAIGSLTSAIFSFFSARQQHNVQMQQKIVPTQIVKTNTSESISDGKAGEIKNNDFSIHNNKIKKLGENAQIVYGNIQNNVILSTTTVAEKIWNDADLKPSEKVLKKATVAYLDFLLDRHQYLTMKGIGPAENIPLKLKLLDLYVPLKARREVPKGETWDRQIKLAGRNLNVEGVEETPSHRLGDPEPVLKILKENSGLIILGDPGAGKTTFLKFVTIMLARGGGPEIGVKRPLPILVPLAAYANELLKKNTRLDDFITKYFEEIGCDFPIGIVVSNALEKGKAIIMMDGLDEIKKQSLRNTVIERVIDFYASHRRQGNKFVVTSRVVGYRDVRAVAEGLVECTLVDFNDIEISEFISKWTVSIETQALGDTNVARLDAESERRELLEAMKANDGIRSLASNPLLLTILVLMKRKGVTLPERRVQLYDQYVTTLLSTWNRARSLSGRTPGRDLDEIQTTRVLAKLALWMHEINPGIGLVKHADLHRKLMQIFKECNNPYPEKAAGQFLQDVREYTSILLERGLEEYGFIHLTFEEYLAALALAFEAQGDSNLILDALVPHIGDPTWREVTLLCVSYIGIRQNMPRVAGLVVEGLASATVGEAGEASVLAGDAVVDAWPDGVSKESKDNVIKTLIPTMVNQNANHHLRRRAGLTLSQLGWKPKDLFDFIKITPGKFIYGPGKVEHEIIQPYWIAKYPVTNLQYYKFIEKGGYENKKWWSKEGWYWLYSWKNNEMITNNDWRDQGNNRKRIQPSFWENKLWNASLSPVVGISWFEAKAYCKWLDDQSTKTIFPTGYIFRLPTDDEWERAASYTDGREFPWGDLNYSEFANTIENKDIGTTAVCTYPLGQSKEGIMDLSGNVWEWLESKYEKNSNLRVLRGGSWNNDRGDARCSYRFRDTPESCDNDLGFRVVVSQPISENDFQ